MVMLTAQLDPRPLMNITRFAITMLGALALLPGTLLHAADTAAAKKIFASHQDSVIWVSAVAKISVSAEGRASADREQKVETLGTIIDPSGMVVTSLMGLDPAAAISGRELRARTGGSTLKVDASSTLKEVRLLMPDSTEVPAEVVMRDADLDLAFVRVKPGAKEAKDVTFKAVDLKASAKVEVSDDIVSLGRTDESFSRQPMITRGQITAITKKPREFLRASAVNAGCPTFAMDGKIIGIAASRAGRGRGPGGAQTVVIPAADVLEIAEQAKNAKPTE